MNTQQQAAASPGPRPIGLLLGELAAEEPERPVLTCGERTISRLFLERRSNRLARAYANLGVKQGDFVIVALPNGIEWFEAVFAVWKLGACPLPLSPKFTEVERRRIMDLARPSLLIGVALDPTCDVPAIPTGFEPDETCADGPLDGRVGGMRAITSGGSTGLPKLIVSETTNELDPSTLLNEDRHLLRDQVHLVVGPLYHSMPFTWATHSIVRGNHVVVMPRFDATAAVSEIVRHRVNTIAAVPTMLLRMLAVIDAAPTTYDLSSIQLLYHTSARCPEWVKQRWIDLVGPSNVWEIYGGTEDQAATIISGTDWLTHRGSVGRPLFGEFKIFDANGDVAPVGEVGEIYVRRAEGVSGAYHYIGAEPRALGAGWQSLGDMGYVDEDGYLYLVDRRVDMIISGGANIYPAEVERVIGEHPNVNDSVVVGLPDDDLGQRVHALVQISEPLGEDELRTFVEQRLVRYKTPRSYRFVRESLRSEADKVRRSQVCLDEAERLRSETPVGCG